MTKVISARRRAFIGLALGGLERQQDAPADVERVLERLQAGGESLPLVVAEIRVGGAGRDDQNVKRERAVGQDHPLGRQVDRRGIGQHDVDVLLSAEDPADGRRDVGGAQGGRGHLVEQGLKEMVVGAIDDGDPHRRAFQARAAVSPPKPAPTITTWGR